jgi:SAM-dependent methyltransferase
MNLKGGKAETFGKVASFLYRAWAEPTLFPMHERIAAEIPVTSGRLLDVGCGPGRLTRRIAERCPALRVTGIDISADMIRQAQRGPALPNLEFRQGEPGQAAPSGEFDFAISVLSFHHWEEPERDLANVHAALRPGGRFWIYEPDPEASNEDIRADLAPLWGWLRLPAGLQRRQARGHGFSRREIDEVVGPAVARTPFGKVEASRHGSTWRMELRK